MKTLAYIVCAALSFVTFACGSADSGPTEHSVSGSSSQIGVSTQTCHNGVGNTCTHCTTYPDCSYEDLPSMLKVVQGDFGASYSSVYGVGAGGEHVSLEACLLSGGSCLACAQDGDIGN